MAPAELSGVHDLWSLQQREYKLQFNEIDEIKQRLLNFAKAVNTKFE